MTSDFFETNHYFVDKRNKFYYHIYNHKRERVGTIKQEVTTLQKVFEAIIGSAWRPFFVEIRNANSGLEATIFRHNLLSEIIIMDPQGKKVGVITKKNKLFKPEFKITNSSDQIIAEVSDSWKGANFLVYDHSKKQIGSIDKKWNRTMKEKNSSKGSYNVSISINQSEKDDKIAIVASSIFIHMFFFKRELIC